MDKYKNGTYHKGSFRVGINGNISLIMCKNRIFIPSKLQSYVLYWYYVYPLHLGMDRMEKMIFRHLYWNNIIDYFQKEVTNCDTCKHTKQSNKYTVNSQII